MTFHPLRPLQRLLCVVNQIQLMCPKKRPVAFLMAKDQSPLFPDRSTPSSDLVVGVALPANRFCPSSTTAGPFKT